MSIEMNAIVRRNPEMVFSDMDGETVMMSVEKGSYFGLNSVGSHIWEILEKELSVQQICDQLQERFDVKEEQCRDEVSMFLEKMLEQQVIVIA